MAEEAIAASKRPAAKAVGASSKGCPPLSKAAKGKGKGAAPVPKQAPFPVPPQVWPLAGALDDCYTKDDLCLRVSDVSHICVKYKQPWWTLPNDGLQRIKGAS
eukprot:s5789_g3.t1